jgi:hypothetical protein
LAAKEAIPSLLQQWRITLAMSHPKRMTMPRIFVTMAPKVPMPALAMRVPLGKKGSTGTIVNPAITGSLGTTENPGITGSLGTIVSPAITGSLGITVSLGITGSLGTTASPGINARIGQAFRTSVQGTGPKIGKDPATKTVKKRKRARLIVIRSKQWSKLKESWNPCPKALATCVPRTTIT